MARTFSGVVLLQNGQPVAYGSKALSETQKRYAQIEREMLAILYGCQKHKSLELVKILLLLAIPMPLYIIFHQYA
jgi:hypothetical protein